MPDPEPADEALQALLEAGLSHNAADALASLDESIFKVRRRFAKGDLIARFNEKTGLDLEQSHLEGLGAIARITLGIGGNAPREASVGDVAEELNIDPSRASRIVADLVSRKLARRTASQEDARKTIITLTPKAAAIHGHGRKWKLARLARLVDGWEEEEIITFARLFARYAEAQQFDLADE